MSDQYEFISRASELYNLLEDELSKRIFCVRLQFDLTYSMDSALRLFGLSGMLTREELEVQLTWRDTFDRLNRENKKIVLYGAGCCGKYAGDLILKNQSDFFAYCDKRAESFPDGLMGKPVVGPGFLWEHRDDCYVLITTMDYSTEIYDFLLKNRFPIDHILPYFNKLGASFSALTSRMYWEFPDLLPKGRAFVDGGCFDCGDSLKFAVWSGGSYSKILAFEPDFNNYRRCAAAAEKNRDKRIEVIQAGLSGQTGAASFVSNADISSYMIMPDDVRTSLVNISRPAKEVNSIKTIALDDITQNCRVGFVKLDIEGAELSALQGAKNTLLRDRPLLAVCVYHQAGDVLAIMDYLHELIPEYRFWLRHYSPLGCDTVLYASL